MTNCKVCTAPLIDQPDYVTMHDECKLCIYCNHEVGIDIIENRLRATKRISIDSEEYTEQEILDINKEKVKVYHDYCHSLKLEADFKNKPVIITQEHLDIDRKSVVRGK